jgi:integrase
MKHPKPWFRKANKTWYCCINGVQEKLGTDKKEAHDAYHKLMASRITVAIDRTLTVEGLKTIFLNWSKANHEPETTLWYKTFLDSFCQHEGNGKLKAFQILPYHVDKWKTEAGYKERAPVQCVKRLFTWGYNQGILSVDPLKRVKLPPVKSRVVLLSAEEKAEVLNCIKDESFRRFVQALHETGARPGEIAKVTANDVDLGLGLWILKKHKTSKKTGGKPRVIYLTPAMVSLTKELMTENPTGPLFTTMKRVRMRDGTLVRRGYTKNGIRCRFRELRKKLPHIGPKLIAYSYRHSFATEALTKIGVAQVAELMGHTDIQMISNVYGHLSQKVAHMREAAAKAVS